MWESPGRSGDFLKWSDCFELVCKVKRIKDKAAYLPLQLDGPAFEVYHQLPNAEKK